MNSENSTNSTRKAYQFQFELLIQSVIVEYTSTFNFKIAVKKGTKNLETKNTMKYEVGGRKEVDINEQLNIISTVAVKKDVINEFQDKIYKIYLQVYTKQGFKNATFTEYNFSNLLQVNHLNMAVNNKPNFVELDFKKSPFGYLKMKVMINVKFYSEIDLSNINQGDFSRLSIDGLEMDNGDSNKKIENESSNTKNKNLTNLTSNVANIVNASSSILSSSTGNSIPNLPHENVTPDSNYINTVTTKRKNSFFKTNNENSSLNTEANANTNSNEEIILLNENIRVLNKKVEDLEKEKNELKDKLSVNQKNTNNKRLTEELRDKETIISELKNENEYYAEEISQQKSIISDLKAEKNKVYEEKMQVIKQQKEEIDSFKAKINTLEREQTTKTKENANTMNKLDENTKLVESFKKKISDLE